MGGGYSKVYEINMLRVCVSFHCYRRGENKMFILTFVLVCRLSIVSGRQLNDRRR